MCSTIFYAVLLKIRLPVTSPICIVCNTQMLYGGRKKKIVNNFGISDTSKNDKIRCQNKRTEMQTFAVLVSSREPCSRHCNTVIKSVRGQRVWNRTLTSHNSRTNIAYVFTEYEIHVSTTPGHPLEVISGVKTPFWGQLAKKRKILWVVLGWVTLFGSEAGSARTEQPFENNA